MLRERGGCIESGKFGFNRRYRKRPKIEDQHHSEITESKSVTKRNNIFFKKKREVLSGGFGKKLIEKVHQVYGHIGTKQILQLVRPLYYFKNMDKRVEEVYSTCEICRKNKSRTTRPIGKLSKLGPATKPFEIMSIDTVGGFGGLKSPKKYLHILLDHFTRKAFVSTSKHQTSKEIIKLIDKVAREHHIGMILADQYSALNSRELK